MELLNELDRQAKLEKAKKNLANKRNALKQSAPNTPPKSIFDASPFKHIKNNLRWRDNPQPEVYKIVEVVDGYIDLSGNQLVSSLPRLKKIGSNAVFKESIITSIPQLESIGGYANFANSNIHFLPKLKIIRSNAFFEGSKITELPELVAIGGHAKFNGTAIKSLPALEAISEDADFTESDIQFLPNLKIIIGNAIFNGTKITALPKLEYVGYIDLTTNSITSLPSLKAVNSLKVSTEIKDLPKLEKVNCTLDMYQSTMKSLPSLVSAGEIYVSINNLIDFPNLKECYKIVVVNKKDNKNQEFTLAQYNKLRQSKARRILYTTKDALTRNR